jgi:hypothetical protein
MYKEDPSLFSSSLFSVQFNSKLKNLKSVILIKRNTSGLALPKVLQHSLWISFAIEGKSPSHTPLYSLFLSSEILGNFRRLRKGEKHLLQRGLEATTTDKEATLHITPHLTYRTSRIIRPGLCVAREIWGKSRETVVAIAL